MVTDNIYPGSPLWNAQVDLRKLAPQAFRREVENLPEAFKQLLILITPGGGLAFLLTLRHLSRWERHNANTALAWIVTLNVFTLVGGYCMLVLDARYILPLLPLLVAFAVRFLLPSSSAIKGAFRRSLPSILFVASTVCLLFYWASPFRTMNRDYQVGVYSIASSMRSLPSCDRLAVIGKGPFPEHGVGWETGMYASYFAGCRVVAFSEEIPSTQTVEAALADLKRLQPDSILILGPQESYGKLLESLRQNNLYLFSMPLLDPYTGRIGQLLWEK